MAIKSQIDSLREGQICYKTSFTGVKDIIREMYPEMTPRQIRLAQDNVSHWFRTNKGNAIFDPYRDRFPLVFKKAKSRAKINLDDVMVEKTEHVTEKVTEQVESIQDCIQAIMGKSQAKIKWSQGDQTLEAEWSN